MRDAVDKVTPTLDVTDTGDRNSSNDEVAVGMTRSTSEFNLKAIQQIELKEYSGESDKYQEWFESTERQFGRAAAQPLLHDKVICTKNIEVSYAAKCIVATSLKNGSALYLNTT